jgi:hypothetical protein
LKGPEEPERDRVASAGVTAPEFATATERVALCGFLNLQRAALIRKVQVSVTRMPAGSDGELAILAGTAQAHVFPPLPEEY